jgi:hypothetical protein
MKRQPQASQQEQEPKAPKNFKGNRFLFGLTAEGMSPTSATNVASIIEGLSRREDSTASLNKQTGKQEYLGDMGRAMPLASVNIRGGTTEQITHLVFVGLTPIGLRRTLDENNVVTQLHATLLPAGGNRYKGEVDPKDLITIDTHDLVGDGSIGLQQLLVTKSMLTDAGGHKDPSLDDNQALITFSADGALDITDIGNHGDGSTNGVHIMTMDDVASMETGIPDAESFNDAVRFVHELQDFPKVWIPNFTEPQQRW